VNVSSLLASTPAPSESATKPNSVASSQVTEGSQVSSGEDFSLVLSRTQSTQGQDGKAEAVRSKVVAHSLPRAAAYAHDMQAVKVPTPGQQADDSGQDDPVDQLVAQVLGLMSKHVQQGKPLPITQDGKLDVAALTQEQGAQLTADGQVAGADLLAQMLQRLQPVVDAVQTGQVSAADLTAVVAKIQGAQMTLPQLPAAVLAALPVKAKSDPQPGLSGLSSSNDGVQVTAMAGEPVLDQSASASQAAAALPVSAGTAPVSVVPAATEVVAPVVAPIAQVIEKAAPQVSTAARKTAQSVAMAKEDGDVRDANDHARLIASRAVSAPLVQSSDKHPAMPVAKMSAPASTKAEAKVVQAVPQKMTSDGTTAALSADKSVVQPQPQQQGQAASVDVAATVSEAVQDQTAVAVPQKGDGQLLTVEQVAPRPAQVQLHADAQSLAQPRPAAPAEQVAVQFAKVPTADGSHVVRIDLAPADLGRVQVSMEIKDGAVKATVHAENSVTLDALRADARVLERSLADAGLTVKHDSLQFDLRDQQGNSQGWQQPQQQAQQNQGDVSFEEALTGKAPEAEPTTTRLNIPVEPIYSVTENGTSILV
jgi:flagellar hook-length control protein FliK